MDKPSTAQGTPTSAAFPRAKTRVGIIEVGSRATRLLVADVQGADVNPVKSTSRSIALAKALAASPQQALVTLKDVKRTILGLKAEARQSNANIIRCFGTAAMPP